MSDVKNGIVPKLQERIAELEAAWVELRAYCQRGIEAKERYGDAVYVGSVQSLYNVITKMDELLPKTVADVAPVVVRQPCKTCEDKLIIWQWTISSGFAHLCPDCADNYSIEQLEARKIDKPFLDETERIENAMIDKLIKRRKTEIEPDNAPKPEFKIGDMVTIPSNVIPPFVMPITAVKWYGDTWMYELDGRSFWAENTIESASDDTA